MTGEELRIARERVHLTQKKLGELLGYSDRGAERMVQQWEHDKFPINPKHYRKLAEVLDVPLEKFIP